MCRGLGAALALSVLTSARTAGEPPPASAAIASLLTIQALPRDLVGVQLSRGQLVRPVRRANGERDPTYLEMRLALPREAHQNMDHNPLGRMTGGHDAIRGRSDFRT